MQRAIFRARYLTEGHIRSRGVCSYLKRVQLRARRHVFPISDPFLSLPDSNPNWVFTPGVSLAIVASGKGDRRRFGDAWYLRWGCTKVETVGDGYIWYHADSTGMYPLSIEVQHLLRTEVRRGDQCSTWNRQPSSSSDNQDHLTHRRDSARRAFVVVGFEMRMRDKR